eukprot:scaffold6361_cov132-Isochrysis_galbana.AAC.6
MPAASPADGAPGGAPRPGRARVWSKEPSMSISAKASDAGQTNLPITREVLSCTCARWHSPSRRGAAHFKSRADAGGPRGCAGGDIGGSSPADG